MNFNQKLLRMCSNVRGYTETKLFILIIHQLSAVHLIHYKRPSKYASIRMIVRHIPCKKSKQRFIPSYFSNKLQCLNSILMQDKEKRDR